MDAATRNILENQILIMEVMAELTTVLADKKKLLEQVNFTKGLIRNHY